MKEEKIEFNKFLKKWKEKDLTDKTLHLFIDNPFCVRKCNFCYFSSTKTSIGSDIYNKYYNEFLPKLLTEYKDILKSNKINSVYFGGGTSSLMTVDIMKNIFKLIPGFKKIPGKVFESHPAFMTTKKAELLIKNNFTYVTFGVQSFDKERLKKENRLPLNIEKLKKDVKFLQENGIKVNCDLIVFFEELDNYEIDKILENLKIMTEEIKPDTITIYPNIRVVFHENFNIENKEKTYKYSAKLRRKFLKFSRKNKEYHFLKDQLSLDIEHIKKTTINNYFCIKISDEEFDKMRVYDSSSYPYQNKDQNVLGIGGYGERRTYSYFGRDEYYKIYNRNWKLEVKKVMEE